ncbi:MAG: hypothetical protein U1E54_03600, partial [Candidatus Levybacteria bacterium]|nr:hypothetical protein [Candidatus Levybacteria bacterium]
MKKILLVLFLIFHFSFLISPAHAVTPTPSPEDKTQEIKDQLITNIASRVAQLKLVEKRGIMGKVTDVTNTQITITDIHNNTRFIDVDELTKFSSPTAKGTYGISDITKDTTIGVLGLYNKESRRILARFVNTINIPIIVHGGVAAIDNENFSIDITTEEGQQMTVDIENITKTFSYTTEDGYARSGFSKIKDNYNIIVSGVMDIKEKNRMTATRVIIFPEIPAGPKINAALNKTS